MRKAIVTAADSRYLPVACCALISCVMDGDIGDQAKLFLVASDVSISEVENVDSFLKDHGVSVEVIVINTERLKRFRVDGYISAASYSKLLLSEIFDGHWDRILYVDADTRIMEPVQTLFDASLRNKPIGVVHDYVQYMIYGIADSRERLGLRADAPYFNAGVICFDWQATIASGLLQRAQAFAIENANLCLAHDQDALNKAFEGAWAPLDPRWNFIVGPVPEHVLQIEYPARLRSYISHFAGPLKPWMTNYPERLDQHRAWYDCLLRESPWPHYVGPLTVPRGGASLTLAVNYLKRWVLGQGGKPRVAKAKAELPYRSEDGLAQKYSMPIAWEKGNANPELEKLFDLLIAESAGDNICYAY